MKNAILLTVLLIFSALAYHSWFSLEIFTNGDWWFNYSDSLSEQINPSIWDGRYATGSVDPLSFRAPINILVGILSSIFTIDSNIIDRILFFWPQIFLLPMGAYLLIYRIVRSDIGAFVGSFIIAFNTYFLAIDTEGHNLITIAASFAILGLYFVISAYDNERRHRWVIAAILFSVAGFMDFRVLYVILGVCVMIYLRNLYLNRKIIHETRLWSVVILIIILLNIIWVLPTLFLSSSFGEGVLSRPLFGDQFWSLSNAITIMYPFWTGSEPVWFSTQHIPFYFWFIPILALIGFLVSNKKPYVMMFALIGVIGIFLSKQSDAPVGWVYSLAYQKIPGFNAFREATKFYLLIILSYAVLISYLVEWFIRNERFSPIKYILPIVVCLLFGLNTLPMITGSIGTMFVPKHIEADYLTVKDTLTQDAEYYRTYWSPISGKWVFRSSVHPMGNFTDLTSNQVFSSYLSDLRDNQVDKKFLRIISRPYTNPIFDVMSVRYIGIPTIGIETGEDRFKNYGGLENPNIREWYITQLDSLPYLKRVDIGTKDLVVYENNTYLPHVRPMSSLIGYSTFADFDFKYNFSRDVLELPFDFMVIGTDEPTFPITRVINPFENLSSVNLHNNMIVSTTTSSVVLPTYYTNVSSHTLSFIRFGDELSFRNTYIPGLKLGTTTLDQPFMRTMPIAKLTIDPTRDYIALVGSLVVHLDTRKTWQPLVPAPQPVSVYEVARTNVIPNGSFEDGMWQDRVGDCYKIDNQGLLGMSRYYTSGSSSLELSATRHIACTNTTSNMLDAGGLYLFSFDYEGQDTTKAGYNLLYDDKATTTTRSEQVSVMSKGWNSYQRVLRIPYGATNVRLTLYAYPSDGITTNVVRYDNVQLLKLTKVADIDPRTPTHFKSAPLPSGHEYNFTFSEPSTNLVNLIPNGDLSRGLWNNSVGDCYNYDDEGKLDMREVEDIRDGGKSLELEAIRHAACTGPGPLPVVEGTTYLLSFDYQGSIGNSEASYYIGWGGTTTPAISEHLHITDVKWHTYAKQITVPYGASSASLLVYAYEKDGKIPVKMRYDNFSFIQLPDIKNRYYLVSNSQSNFVEPREVTFHLISPTKKLVHIKIAATPFYLAVSESYHSQWQAELNNAKSNGTFTSWIPWVHPDKIQDDYHFKLDGFLNGWYVDPVELCGEKGSLKEGCTMNEDGSYNIELMIEFTPQRWFYVGLIISGTTLLSCLGYLGYDFVRRRRQGAQKSH